MTAQPNIILLVLEAVRYDHLSCYGYARATTPNIDRLAERGVIFENCFSAAPFLLASGALRIMVWSLILIALNHALGPVLLAALREKVNLWIVAINALVSLVFGLILVSQFALIGAAITALVTKIVSFFQVYVSVSRLLSKIALGRLAWKPVVASTCMAVYLIIVRSLGVSLAVVSAGVAYAVTLLVLII